MEVLPVPENVRLLAELLIKQGPFAGNCGRRRRLELNFDERDRLVSWFDHPGGTAQELEQIETVIPAESETSGTFP